MQNKYRKLWVGLMLALGLVSVFWLSTDMGVAARQLLAPGNPLLHPVANAHDVPCDTAVSITYDSDIQPATVTTRTFAVHAMQTGQILEAYSFNGGEIKVTPTHPFHPGELVQVSATTGTLGTDATAPLLPTLWQFWTQPMSGTATFIGAPPSWGTTQRTA